MLGMLLVASSTYAKDIASAQARTVGECKYHEDIASLGGFKVLAVSFRGSKRPVVKDVTGVAEDGEDGIVYSVSPIYGRPGLFRIDCKTGRRHVLVKPKTLSKSYPHGADYFELLSLGEGRVSFYYAPDLDETDFNSFRTRKNLFEVRLDGTNLRHAGDKQ